MVIFVYELISAVIEEIWLEKSFNWVETIINSPLIFFILSVTIERLLPEIKFIFEFIWSINNCKDW